jgi:hypothetical protein
MPVLDTGIQFLTDRTKGWIAGSSLAMTKLCTSQSSRNLAVEPRSRSHQLGKGSRPSIQKRGLGQHGAPMSVLEPGCVKTPSDPVFRANWPEAKSFLPSESLISLASKFRPMNQKGRPRVNPMFSPSLELEPAANLRAEERRPGATNRHLAAYFAFVGPGLRITLGNIS